MAVVATLRLYFRRHEPASRNGGPEPAVTPLVFRGLALLAFMCAAVDSSLGMG